MSQPHPPIPEPQQQPGSAPTGATRYPADERSGDQRPTDHPTVVHPGTGHPTAEHPATEHPATEPAVTGTTEDPRTQSILLPPSQRETVEPDAGGHGSHPPYQPSYDPPPAPHGADPVDAAPGSTPTAPPVPGPATTPGTTTAGAPDGGSTSPSVRSRLAGRASGRPATELVALLLGVLGVALLQLGLGLDVAGRSLWGIVPTWSVFATVAALVALASPVAALAGRREHARTAWRIGAGGLVALGAFWVLVALPFVASDPGFWLTAALAATGAAVALAPGRPE